MTSTGVKTLNLGRTQHEPTLFFTVDCVAGKSLEGDCGGDGGVSSVCVCVCVPVREPRQQTSRSGNYIFKTWKVWSCVFPRLSGETRKKTKRKKKQQKSAESSPTVKKAA